MRKLITRLLLVALIWSAPFLSAAAEIDELRAKAEKGDDDALFQLVRMYMEGDGVPEVLGLVGALGLVHGLTRFFRRALSSGAMRAKCKG